jgi:hypothetical protein
MQTTGATLLAVSRCSLACMWMLARAAVARTGCCILLLYAATGASMKIVGVGIVNRGIEELRTESKSRREYQRRYFLIVILSAVSLAIIVSGAVGKVLSILALYNRSSSNGVMR